MTNILIVDTDLGLVFWLGQILDAAGYETYPAKGVAEAVSLMSQLHLRIDALIIRPTLEGAQAFASELRNRQRGHLKAIALLADPNEETECPWFWDSSHVKPELPDQEARGSFLTLVRGVLSPDGAVTRR